MSSIRRRAVRRSRRVQVHFWRQGDPKPFIGYSTNISMAGMFIATNSPLVAGSRVRVELVDRERGFMVEGVVVHARKLHLEKLTQSGMGVRFLNVEELVRELIPGGFAETPENAATDGFPIELLREAAAHPVPSTPEAPAPVAPLPESPPPPPVVAAPPAVPWKAAPPVAAVDSSGGTFTVRFTGVEEFLTVYRRDLLQGGLFVSTRFPARLGESVLVELYPPGAAAERVMVRARVVQRFEPHTGDEPNLLSGMGLELMDLPALIVQLEPVIARLQGTAG